MPTSENPGPPQSAPAPPAVPTEPWRAPAPPPPMPPPAPGFAQPMPPPPASDRFARPTGPIGQIRPTGLTVLLFFVTLGIWGFVYFFQVHEEMKRHSGEGLGGPIALVIAVLLGLVSPFVLSHEVGALYTRAGRRPPVTALTGLWYFPGILVLVGPFVWFVQTNRALNEYWAGLGAR